MLGEVWMVGFGSLPQLPVPSLSSTLVYWCLSLSPPHALRNLIFQELSWADLVPGPLGPGGVPCENPSFTLL